MTTAEKQCTKCKRWFPATPEYFNRSSRIKCGFYSSCRECRAKFRAENKDRIKQQKKIEYAKHRQKYLEHAKTPTAKAQVQRYYQEHREEIIAQKRGYQKLNPDIKRKSDKAYYQRHRAKHDAQSREYYARKFGAPGRYTPDDVADMHKQQNGRCWWCSCAVGNTYHVDHITPLSRGGTNYPDNLVIACPECNQSKNNRLPYSEWMPPNPLYKAENVDTRPDKPVPRMPATNTDD